MSIPEIHPSPHTIDMLAKIDKKSQAFYVTCIQGKKLHDLKPWLNICRRDFYQSLDAFFKTRKAKVGPPQLYEVLDALQLIKDLKKIYGEMELQERRYLIRIIRKVGANPIASALAFILTVALTTYTAIAFGITPVFKQEILISVCIVTGIIVVVIFAILTLALEALRKYYEKVEIGEFDLLERTFFSTYFKHFGALEFDKCSLLVKEMDPNLRTVIEYKWRSNLLKLAKEWDHTKRELGDDFYRYIDDSENNQTEKKETYAANCAYLPPFIENLNIHLSQNFDPLLPPLHTQNSKLTSQGSLLFQAYEYASDDESNHDQETLIDDNTEIEV